ncbi:MAG: class I SAM-dependent methyltransferase [Alphaproteobacteria bacterium]
MQPLIFNPALIALHQRRAAPRFYAHDALWQVMCARLKERLDEIHHGTATRLLLAPTAAENLDLLRHPPQELLGLTPQHYDAIASLGVLHLMNDVVGQLVQMRLALTPGGLLLALFPGGASLQELRASLAYAESELMGGISPRVAPFLDPREAGNLLTRAGFKEPVIDSETITLTYPDLRALMHELRGMGQANPLTDARKNFTPRGLFARAESYYRCEFGDEDGRLPMTVELLPLTAWA